MRSLSFNFLAAVPVGHRVRTYLAEREIEPSSWISSGVVSLLFDLDTGVVFASPSVLRNVKKIPGEPVPKDPDLRWRTLLEGKVAYCHVSSSSGEFGELTTEVGIEPTSETPYR